jgi:two-component system sensor histidine kinase KdpD
MLQQAALCLERLSLEKEARVTQVKIETEAMRSLILGSVSHDFRTPLTVIEGAAEQIGSAADTPPSTKDLSQLILEHSQRLSRVVNNALAVTKLESESPKLNLEWECIEEIIGQALAKYRTKLADRDIETEYPDVIPFLRVDSVLLDQLLSNIIENSLSHAKGATKLCFTIEVENGLLRLLISDDGPGVRYQHEAYRPKPDTETHSGTGLGVRICDLIARLHGGRFEMATGEDGGAVVIVEFPIPPREQTEETHVV